MNFEQAPTNEQTPEAQDELVMGGSVTGELAPWWKRAGMILATAGALGGATPALSEGQTEYLEPENAETTTIDHHQVEEKYNPYSYEEAIHAPYHLVYEYPNEEAIDAEFAGKSISMPDAETMTSPEIAKQLEEGKEILRQFAESKKAEWRRQKEAYDELSPAEQQMFRQQWEQKIQNDTIEQEKAQDTFA